MFFYKQIHMYFINVLYKRRYLYSLLNLVVEYTHPAIKSEWQTVVDDFMSILQ